MEKLAINECRHLPPSANPETSVAERADLLSVQPVGYKKKIAQVRIQPACWLATALLTAILAPNSFAHTRSTDVTWVKDIQPIVQARCTGCHAPGGSAQISLLTYQDARVNARAIREEVLEGRMPPWPAARGLGDFDNDRSLTALEIELLTAWADGNAPLGKVDATPAASASSRSNMSSSVRTIPLPTGHPIRSVETFVVEPETTSTKWITGWAFRPGEPAQVDRAVFSIDGRDMLGSWTPGDRVTHFPSGVGKRLTAGSRIQVELHYRKSTAAVMAASALDLYLGPPARSALHHQLLHCGSNNVTQRIAALAVTPFAAAAGESVEVIARGSDGSVKPLVVIPQFAPANQLTYRLRTSVQLPRRSAIEVRSSASSCGAALEFIDQPARALERSH